ncbi:MAG: hypothetical protein Q7U51_04490 [Methanoregula sp.]|nr:hypothetical protein [Methanoregula sp.]
MTTQRIETGTHASDILGFSEQLFSGWLEVYDDNLLYLHYIISREKNEGNTQALLRQWLSKGYDVRVVMPRPIMQHILKKLRFVPSREHLPDYYADDVEVWYRPGAGHADSSRFHPAVPAGSV